VLRAPVRVLLVEDQPADAKLIALALEADPESDFRLARVGRLAEAISSLTGAPSEAVLLDLGLPDSEGVPSVARLRRAAGAAPVIVLSGSDDPDRVRAALEAGAQEYVVKRLFPRGYLGGVVRSAIRHRRLERWAAGEGELTAADRIDLEAEGEGLAVVGPEGIVFANAEARWILGESRAPPPGQHPVPAPLDLRAGEEIDLPADPRAGRARRTVQLLRRRVGPEGGRREMLHFREVPRPGETPSAVSGSGALLDPEACRRLEELAAGDRAFLATVVEAFTVEAARLLPELASAFEQTPDLLSGRRVAHALKSSAAQLGARTLSRDLTALEAACDSGRADDARSLVRRILDAYPSVEAALRQRFLADGPSDRSTPR
jgi:CheY-like chemotaxis protein